MRVGIFLSPHAVPFSKLSEMTRECCLSRYSLLAFLCSLPYELLSRRTMKLSLILKSQIIALCLVLLSIGLLHAQGKVYLVLGSDTATWDGMDVSRFHCTYSLALFTDPGRNAYKSHGSVLSQQICRFLWPDDKIYVVDDGRQHLPIRNK